MRLRDISTTSGILRGVEADGVFSLLGVPYGADTSGDGRFRAPRDVPPWSGVRDALVFGDAAPQLDSRGPLERLMHPRNGSPLEGAPMGEDCLRLNVWAPAGDSEAKLPVLVWLHGGGYLGGSGNEMWFNGDVLAATGDVVVVTVTHRLGALGFLDLRPLDEPDSAHAGMLDIIAALEWVQRNIAEVGGDPARVTVAGQSGGSAKVAALCAMPAAGDLFARAAMMSGPFARVVPQESVSDFRERFLQAAGTRDVGTLREMSQSQLLAAQGQALAGGGAHSFDAAAMESMAGIGPVLDPLHLPAHPFWPFATPNVAGKQLLIGWTSHEVGSLLPRGPRFNENLTRDVAVAMLDGFGVADAAREFDVAAAHDPSEPPNLLFARILSTTLFAEPGRQLARVAAMSAAAVFTYEFAEHSDALGGLLGACHSLDIAYFFGTGSRIPLVGETPARRDLSSRMSRALISFAASGAPEDPAGEWAPWADERGASHRFTT